MGIAIAAYTADRVDAVRAFNARLAAVNGFARFRLPEQALPELPPGPDRPIFQEHFLALENGDVRGGYILRHQQFSFAGSVKPVAHYRLPLSEGVANKAYAGVAVQMLRSALERQPLLFALGMGGLDRPLPRMLKAAGWSLVPVPFYFYVAHPRAFLRNIRPLRASPPWRAAADLAAFTRLGWAAIRTAHIIRTRRAKRPPAEVIPEFGAAEDELWKRCAPRYALCAVRDSRALNLLYPPDDARFIRLRVSNRGWALLLDTRMQGDHYFGDLRVGTLVDGMAEPEHAAEVVAAAAAFLRDRGVDLIVSNQSHTAWCAALARAGFLRGPSNFVFAVSRQLAAAFSSRFSEAHVNRGDGDGPIHL